MPNYSCESCGFNSKNKKNYSSHITTKKHLEKVKQLPNDTQTIPKVYSNNTKKISITYKCTHCNNIFSNASSLGRHKKTCINTKHKDNEIQNLKKENERIQQEAKEREFMIKQQAKEKELSLKKQAKEKEKMLIKQLETYMNLLQTFTQRV